MTWSQVVADSGRGFDPKSPEIDELQKKIFADATKASYYLDLAGIYLKKKYFHQALAVAQYGSSTFSAAKDDFAVIQGCSLTNLGLYNEGQFFLKSASDYQNLKSGCMAQLKERAR